MLPEVWLATLGQTFDASVEESDVLKIKDNDVVWIDKLIEIKIVTCTVGLVDQGRLTTLN